MTSQHRGKITSWKEDKGYGFITPAEGGKDVFVHISSMPDGLKRPPAHADVTYTLRYDNQQRPQAISIRFDRDPVTMPVFPAMIAGLFFVGLAAAIMGTHTSPLIFVAYAAVSGLTFMAYGIDKTTAVQNELIAVRRQKEQRVPEDALHILELCGGWPGALVAQWYYRHKNRKESYQTAYWVTVALNLLILGSYFVVSVILS
jgi:uncharacterized membrane protein YsdA (DUF1294 family)/cold shock CspA family protein